jgi:hypothetical protein
MRLVIFNGVGNVHYMLEIIKIGLLFVLLGLIEGLTFFSVQGVPVNITEHAITFEGFYGF